MQQLFAFLMTTLDGYDEGPGRAFDFWVIDDEFDEFSVHQLDEVDTLVLGRATYEGMAAYWPTTAAAQDDPRIAARMNCMPKLVVSRTLDRAEWENTHVLADPAELAAVKRQLGKGIAVLGSSALTVSLLRIGLVDELRIMVNPVVLGSGRSVFRTATERLRLELVRSRTFDSGNVLLTYRPTGR
jgi:dihydrofolate reductase